MKKYAEANKVGVYRRLRSEGLVVGCYPGGYPYFHGGVLVSSNALSPIYSYGKNYEVDGQEFSLFVWTTEKDPTKILKHFAKAVKSVTKNQVDAVVKGIQQFVYLDKDYEVK